MRVIVLLLAASLAFTSAALHAQPGPPARGNPRVEYAGQSVDEMIASFMEENDVPGMSLAIVQAPYITRATGYGVGDRERRTLVSANTVFDVAQMKNAFTAVAVMQLVEMGKLGLEDPIGKYVPSPSKGGAETVRDLLRDPAHYDLLEQLIEKATGGRYEDFIRRNQFERLGLQHTFFAPDLEAMQHEKPRAGEKHRRFLRESSLIDPTEPATGYRAAVAVPPPPRSIHSSATDVSIWDIALAGEILVKDPALRSVLYVPAALGNGRKQPAAGAWTFPGHEGLMVTTGSADGSSSLLSRFTKSDELVCVTLLANKEGLDLTQLARRIAGAHNVRIGPPAGTAAMRVQQSPYAVGETLSRLERILRERGVTVVARIDHSKAAISAGMTLGPTEELIFGSPANGTELVQNNRSVAVELPLRAAAWESDGEVWLAATDPFEIVKSGGIAGRNDTALRMRRAIDEALLLAVSADPGSR